MKSTTVIKTLPDVPGLDLQNVSNPHTSIVESNKEHTNSKPTGQPSTSTITHRVIYQAEDNGSFATYNPSFILRKMSDGREYEIKLPSKSGTMALLSDIDEKPIPENVITREKLQKCLNSVVKEDFPTKNYTMSELVDSYNDLIRALRNLIKEN